MAFSIVRRWLSFPTTPAVAVTPREAEPVGAEAQFLRALKCADVQALVQDYAQAAHWYGQAAEQNHAPAQVNLALLYRQGQGVARSVAKSLMWLTRAASLGNAEAQYRLGVQQHLVSRDDSTGTAAEGRIEALKWVRLSAGQSYHGAEGACEYVALGMTRAEVAESARRTAAFVAIPTG
jgi:TPR repeat protein